MKEKELSDYAGLVAYALASGEESISLENKDRDHARALISQIIGSARESITILCHRLARDVYGSREVASALIKAYLNNPNLRCKVYLREKPQITPFLMILANHGVLPVTLDKEVKMGDILVVDGESGREESDPESRIATGIIRNKAWAAQALQKLEDVVRLAV